MAYGFEVVNNNAQVLISNQSRTLHFVGKASYIGLQGSLSQCGGMRLFAYRIACQSTPVPFFTMPTEDYYAVVGVRQEATGSWIIEVLRSGISSSVPEVYVFTDPRGIAYSGHETHGLQVFCDDGTLSFDSRMSPLVVTGGVSVVPPSSPVNPDWYIEPYWEKDTEQTCYRYWPNYATYYAVAVQRPSGSGSVVATIPGNKATGDPSPLLTPTNGVLYGNGYSNQKPIFFFPSLAQSTRICSGRYTSGSAKTPNGHGGYIYFSTWRCMSNYWAMYRGGISLANGSLRCGWITYTQGAYWKAWQYNAGWSIGTGVYPGSGVAGGAGGYPPYYNEAVNITATPVIIANGSRYD